jgi:hypothetical protein
MNSGYGSPPTRRRVLAVTAAGAFASTLAKPFLAARAAEPLVVRDPGGVWSPAASEAFYKPFSRHRGGRRRGGARPDRPMQGDGRDQILCLGSTWASQYRSCSASSDTRMRTRAVCVRPKKKRPERGCDLPS